MKNLFRILVVVVSILVVFISCEKSSVIDTEGQSSLENIPLTSLEGVNSDILIEGDGNFEKVITSPLVKNDGCRFIVSGTIEYRVNGIAVVVVDFGDGTCDNIATKTENGITTEFELDRKYEFDGDKRDGKRGFDYERIIVNPLIRIADCDYIVAGTIELLKEGVVIAVIDFGDGECDNLATETIDGVTKEFELDGKEDKNRGDWNKDRDGKHEGWKCFELVLPVTYIMPDGSTITVENKEGYSVLKEWYAANPNATEKPALQFPVDVIFKDGTTITINNEEEMGRIKEACEEKKWNKGKKCFDLAYPVTYIMPDGSTITVENKEGYSILKEWYAANPNATEKPALQFPVDIVYETEEGDSTVTINNEEEMRLAYKDCYERARSWNEDKKCFDLVFPITFIMPDESTITIENKEGYGILREWYAANPDATEKPVLQFPVDIVYETEEGDSTVTINTEEEMRSAHEDCRGEDGESDRG